MKKVFISRELEPGSAFIRLLQAEGFELIARSLLYFSLKPFSTLPLTEWVFFYSKNAVRFFFEGLKRNKIKLDTGVQLAAMGRATAVLLGQHVPKVDFTGDGNAGRVAQNFLPFCKGKKVLFPQARHSLRSVQLLLGDRIEAHDLVVYDNQPIRDIDIPQPGVLVFTSPMNARTYFGKYQLHEKQKVIAIGESTALALAEMGIAEVELAAAPSEEAMARAVIKVIAG